MLAVLLATAAGPLVAQEGVSTTARLDVFRKLDTNGDAQLTGAEAAKRREVAAGFKQADKDRDGRLSFAEFETIALNRSDQPGRFRNPDRG